MLVCQMQNAKCKKGKGNGHLLKFANLESYYQALLVSLPSSPRCHYDYDLNVNTKYAYLQNFKILQSTPRVTCVSLTIILIITLDVFTRHEKKGAATTAQ